MSADISPARMDTLPHHVCDSYAIPPAHAHVGDANCGRPESESAAAPVDCGFLLFFGVRRPGVGDRRCGSEVP